MSAKAYSKRSSLDDLERPAKSPHGESQLTETEVANAKSYLLGTRTESGLTLYDLLSKLLTKYFEKQPENAVDGFEDISKHVKRSHVRQGQDTVKEVRDLGPAVAFAQIQSKLFSKDDDDDDTAAEVDDSETPLPNLMELSYFFEQASIGLGRDETFRVWLALKSLLETRPLEQVRFWGKILGTEQNYIIAEAEYRQGEEEEEEGEEEETEEKNGETSVDEKEGEDDEENEIDAIPKPSFKPPPTIPKEDLNTGANKKTYFVCNEPGKPWVKLPSVTPAQIVAARKIKKYFTGRLDSPVISFPPFPGKESNYLRAQVARISAGTHISPRGFYKFDEDDEEDSPTTFVVDEEYEPLSIQELLANSMENWVHHVQHILPQGRCTWYNMADDEDSASVVEDEEEGDEEGAERRAIKPEVGPPLLSPLNADLSINGLKPWSCRISSKLMPQFAVATVRSNLWPGACAFANDRIFENIYVGWGHKYSDGYSPPSPAPLQAEYTPLVPDSLMETSDPTYEEEEAIRKANMTPVEEGEEDEVEEDEEENSGQDRNEDADLDEDDDN